MGVPAFFRWLSRKYPSIVVNCVEEKPKIVNDVRVPVDSSQPNPNDIEFDNLYLDMNGIIHPCCHPENKPPPKNEDEMMVLIFEYIDRLFSIIRPRRLLYMAIDGVAPRAKMNQQRSRRFRAAKESIEKREEVARIKDELRMKGVEVPPDKPAEEHFDSNCITPGTPFMFRLAECLRFYIHDRLNNDPGWKGIKVILSDANVPGEGEHKIMDFIRRQRAQPDHDPNTHHCLCGADADLIMLGLATHEPNFTIIREEFKPNQPRPCDICGQIGHEMKECAGVAREKQGEFDELPISVVEEQQFIFLRLNILREYLERELKMTNLPFEQDLERAIDDWVFMCFFVGNDFLPHLPSLEIREGAIDRLVNLYKKAVYKTGGYLTKNGIVNLERVQLVLSDLGEVEDEIFKKRRERDLEFKRRDKQRKTREKRFAAADRPKFLLGGQFAPQALGRSSGDPVQNPRQAAASVRVQSMNFSTSSNEEAAAALKAMLTNGSEPKGQKRPHEDAEDEEEEEPNDEVKLWEDGWKDRYYESKFAVSSDDLGFRRTVANEYVLGLCWVLLYYYQGCPSWKWYFPYHYAPFASDFVNIADLNTEFEKNTEPFKPLEQLMGVFPAASKQHLPVTWQDLMDNPESPIIDFYPIDFKIDLNGKKYAWQGVALLPFVDEKRLKRALEQVYPDLTPEEISRNIRGNDRLFVGKDHPVHDFLEALYEGDGTKEPLDVSTSLTQGLKGRVWCDEYATLTGETVKSPLQELQDVQNNRAIAVKFQDPVYDPDFIFPAVLLPEAKLPGRVLKEEDFNAMNRGGYRPQLGFQRNSHYRPKNSNSMEVAGRIVRGSIGGQGAYGQVPPVRGLMGSAPPYGRVPPTGAAHNTELPHGERRSRWNDPNEERVVTSSSHQRNGSHGNSQQSWQNGKNQQHGYGQNREYSSGSGYSQGGGGYSQGRGGYSQGGGGSRGYSQGRGGYGQDRGGYGQERGSYSKGRGGYGQERGGYSQGRGGYGQGRGGYSQGGDGGRGYSQGRGGYSQPRGGGYSQPRGGGYSQGRGGYGDSRGGSHGYSRGAAGGGGYNRYDSGAARGDRHPGYGVVNDAPDTYQNTRRSYPAPPRRY